MHNDSKYVRNLVRQDHSKNQDFISLKIKLQEGLDSGISTTTLPDIMKEVETRMKQDGSL
jgi:antitoxin ParD1/3/4